MAWSPAPQEGHASAGWPRDGTSKSHHRLTAPWSLSLSFPLLFNWYLSWFLSQRVVSVALDPGFTLESLGEL